MNETGTHALHMESEIRKAHLNPRSNEKIIEAVAPGQSAWPSFAAPKGEMSPHSLPEMHAHNPSSTTHTSSNQIVKFGDDKGPMAPSRPSTQTIVRPPKKKKSVDLFIKPKYRS